MELLNHKSKRVRPLLGTYFGVSLGTPEETGRYFTLASELEAQCSLRAESSLTSKINRLEVGETIAISAFFSRLLEQALLVRGLSNAAFDPFIEGGPKALEFGSATTLRKVGRLQLDLNGIAKGAIVDEVSRQIQTHNPNQTTIVNAGGDMRFSGKGPHTVQIRMGPPDQPLARSLTFLGASVATSSPALSLSRADSTTLYQKSLRRGECVTVTAVAESCAIADALTKVGLFAEAEVIGECAEQLKASIFVFDSGGSLVECYGDA